MQRIRRDQALKYAFDWRDEPLLRVQPGERFALETWDAGAGYFRTPADLAIPGRRPGFDRTPPQANPIAGPVCFEGARRGDTLIVEIDSIEVGKTSWSAVGRAGGRWGALAATPAFRASTRRRFFATRRGPRARHATAHCTSAVGCPGRSLHLSARWAWPQGARDR
jgi:acetamidase/formamidase